MTDYYFHLVPISIYLLPIDIMLPIYYGLNLIIATNYRMVLINYRLLFITDYRMVLINYRLLFITDLYYVIFITDYV